MSRSARANPPILATSASPKVRKLAALIEDWHRLVEVAVDAAPGSQNEQNADAAVAEIDRQIDRVAQTAMSRPAQTPEDVVVLALIAHHMSAAHFDHPATPAAIRNGAAAWELPRAILTLAGYPHIPERSTRP